MLVDLILADQFNATEGLFWCLLGIVTTVASTRTPSRYKPLAYYATTVLVAFGVSDFLQVLYGSFFEPGLEWLFVWKIVNGIALLGIFVWYFVIRLKNK